MSGTVVEELIVKLGIEGDDKKIESVLSSLEDLAKVGAVIAGAFTAVAFGAFKMVSGMATVGDNASTAAEKLNITTDALQSLEHVAIMSDASTEALAAGLKFLGKNAGEAAAGSKEMQEDFARAGIQLRGTNGQLKSVDQLFKELADRFADGKIAKGPAQTAIAMKLLGRAGDALIPMLHRGADGIEMLQQQARDLGIVMDEQTIKAAERFDDSMKILHGSLTGLRNAIAGPFIEVFGRILDRLSKFIQTNKKLIAAKLDVFFRVVAGAANLFLDALEWLFENRGRVEGVLFTLTTLLFGAAAAFLYLQGAAIASALATAATWALALAPFILIGAFIALIVDDLWTFIKGGDSMLGRLIKWTEAINPEDNSITKTLKLWLSLLFDFTDPKKWQAVKDNFKNAFSFGPSKGDKKYDVITGQEIGTEKKGGGNPLKGAWDWLNSGPQTDAAGHYMSGGSSEKGGGNPLKGAWDWLNSGPPVDLGGDKATTIVHAPITVQVPPGTPETIKDDVKKIVDDHFDNKLREAGAVAGKGN